jgi:hypothetical protein
MLKKFGEIKIKSWNEPIKNAHAHAKNVVERCLQIWSWSFQSSFLLHRNWLIVLISRKKIKDHCTLIHTIHYTPANMIPIEPNHSEWQHSIAGLWHFAPPPSPLPPPPLHPSPNGQDWNIVSKAVDKGMWCGADGNQNSKRLALH